MKKTVAKESGLTMNVYDLMGVMKKKVELPHEFFRIAVSPALLAQYMRVYLANQRQGTASTKTRTMVRGSTKKIYRQKGTGRARHGAKTASLFVGGGVTFGPQSRDYSLKMSKKQKRKALYGALSMKQKSGDIIGLATDSLQTPKTKIIATFLTKLNFSSTKTLLIVPKLEKNNFVLASRNIPGVTLIDAKSINPYVLLNNEKIVCVADTLTVLKKHFTTTHEN